MASKPTVTRKKPPYVVITIEYVVSPDYLNLEEILDKLRESGSAEVLNVTTRPADEVE